jgi:organic radical activating enzyme
VDRPKHGLILTGGEPLMQLDQPLLDALAQRFLWIDIETNGTLPFNLVKPPNVFISCSPKTSLIRVTADWYKVLIPHKRHLLEHVSMLAQVNNAPIYVQPVEIGGYHSALTQEHIATCIRLCTMRGYLLSLQLHKIIGVR